jgi:predicted transposase YbfD/YdcC
MANEFPRLVLGQIRKGDDKSNEETAIPRLLDILEIEDCIVAADGAGPLRALALRTLERGAQYVFRVDRGHNLIFEDIANFFQRSRAADYRNEDVEQREFTESVRGKNEVRRYVYARGVNGISPREGWPGMAGVGMAEFVMDGEIVERRYYVSSIADRPEDFFRAVMGHCEGEHQTHWSMSITFPKGRSLDEAAENFAILRGMFR